MGIGWLSIQVKLSHHKGLTTFIVETIDVWTRFPQRRPGLQNRPFDTSAATDEVNSTRLRGYGQGYLLCEPMVHLSFGHAGGAIEPRRFVLVPIRIASAYERHAVWYQPALYPWAARPPGTSLAGPEVPAAVQAPLAAAQRLPQNPAVPHVPREEVRETARRRLAAGDGDLSNRGVPGLLE